MPASEIQVVYKKLTDLACDEGLKWLKNQVTVEKAWRQCQRGDWMMWIISEASFNLGVADQESLYNLDESDIQEGLDEVQYKLDDLFYRNSTSALTAKKRRLYAKRARLRAKLAKHLRTTVTADYMKKIIRGIKNR